MSKMVRLVLKDPLCLRIFNYYQDHPCVVGSEIVFLPKLT